MLPQPLAVGDLLGARLIEVPVAIQDAVLLDDAGAFAGASDEQVANREWLKEHAGW